jgi:ABC-2 type transport system permease protein
MTSSRLLHVYFNEAKYAFIRFLRTPAFVIPTLLFPLFFYLLVGFVFGAFNAKNSTVDVPTFLFGGFATMAAMTPGMFGFGIGLAMEREQGLFTFKRALPMPPLASLLGSVAMSMLSTFLAVLLLATVAWSTGLVKLNLLQIAALIGTVSIGAIPFCAMGLLLGSLMSGRAAPAVTNIIYILLTYFSGLFFPLPKALAFIAAGSPAFYLHQLALAAAGSQNFMIGGALNHIALLVSVTVLCLGLAARRLERVG